MKNFFRFLQLRDGIWSLPLAFAAFWCYGIVSGWLFGYGTGSYDPAFLQPLFLAILIVIGATNAAVLGIYFTFRGLHRYLYGKYKKVYTSKIWQNQSKEDWKKLSEWQRFLIVFVTFFLFLFAIILVYITLV